MQSIDFGTEFSYVYGYVLDGELYINSAYKGSDELVICPLREDK